MPDQLTAMFAALADPTRRQVIELLRREPRKSSELAAALGTSRPAMSRHLRVLRQSGLISEFGLVGDARFRVYQLEPEPFEILRTWIDEIESFWADQLEGFIRHIESDRDS